MKIVSLFSGIGAMDFGVSQGLQNSEVVFASEIDKFASSAYELIHDFKPSGDITKIEAKDIPEHDILIGGFPCQAFSISGKRLGFEDSRGTLFFDVARILKEKMPKYFILENVKGLKSHNKGQTLKTILNILGELEYNVDYRVVNSKDFGVPQNRERIVLMGCKENIDFSKVVFHKSEHKTVLSDILESEVDEKHILKYTLDDLTFKDVTKTIDPKINTVARINPIKSNQRNSVIAVDGISQTILTCSGGNTHVKIIQDKIIRRLTPLEYFRCQGFPDAWYHTLKENNFSDTQLYKMAGNAVTVNVFTEVARALLNPQD